jgi:hypothetical protein
VIPHTALPSSASMLIPSSFSSDMLRILRGRVPRRSSSPLPALPTASYTPHPVLCACLYSLTGRYGEQPRALGDFQAIAPSKQWDAVARMHRGAGR